MLTSAAAAQRYTFAQLADLGDFLDSLRVRVTDATLLTQIDAVRSLNIGPFRIRNYASNGTSDSRSVTRSTGLNIVLPVYAAGAGIASTGPGGFTDYSSNYSGRPWTLFLADWLAAQGTVAYKDQGGSPLELYLVWDTASVRLDADLDLWVLEPNGNLYIPYLGSVTPNGTLTPDSYFVGTAYEGYLTNRFIQVGTFKFYADLYADPSNHRPVLDVVYRNGLTGSFSSLYAPAYPQLSLAVSWLNDPSATWSKIDAGNYTDLKYVSVWTVSPASPANLAPSIAGRTAAPQRPTPSAPEITAPQLERVRELLRGRTRVQPVSRPLMPVRDVPFPTVERP
jgi:hypothetical protein